MKKHNCEQQTKEWFDLHEQYPLTASEAQAIGNQGKGLETLVWTKLSERHSIADKKRYSNNDLERGVELEPLARDIYELQTGNKVEHLVAVLVLIILALNLLYKACGHSSLCPIVSLFPVLYTLLLVRYIQHYVEPCSKYGVFDNSKLLNVGLRNYLHYFYYVNVLPVI